MNDHVLSQIEHFGVLPKVIKGLHLWEGCWNQKLWKA
jgi:hypothetical protein